MSLTPERAVQRAKVGLWPEDVEKSEPSDGKRVLSVLTPGGSHLEERGCKESVARFMDRAYPDPHTGVYLEPQV